MLINKIKIIKEFGKNDKDTGSAEVQVALLTSRIRSLTTHFKMHKKDEHSRYGLLKMVAQRRTLLKNLKSNEIIRYSNIIKKLELRK